MHGNAHIRIQKPEILLTFVSPAKYCYFV